jgi:hypothetical protein
MHDPSVRPRRKGGVWRGLPTSLPSHALPASVLAMSSPRDTLVPGQVPLSYGIGARRGHLGSGVGRSALRDVMRCALMGAPLQGVDGEV